MIANLDGFMRLEFPVLQAVFLKSRYGRRRRQKPGGRLQNNHPGPQATPPLLVQEEGSFGSFERYAAG